MPYIKEKLRENYDPIINVVLLKFSAELPLTDEENFLAVRILNVDEHSQDGELNYFITKLFKRAQWHEKWKGYYDTYENEQGKAFYNFLINVLTLIYLSPEKYYKYNRLTGLIVSVADEFVRRHGDESNCIVLLLNDVKKYFDEKKGIYEDEKIKENGDVTY